MGSCHDNDLYNEMPQPIMEFVAQYFPNTAIQDFTHKGDSYHVVLKNGPGITFGKDYKWLAINGYGMPLPQVFLFDSLPPALYVYLQETENTDNVFAIERDVYGYSLMLLDNTLTYNNSTGRISEHN